jgi:hypothetical protein
MDKKKVIVIGLQHSCSRFCTNILTKHPSVSFGGHFSVPSDDIGSPIKFLIKDFDNFYSPNLIIVFCDRDYNYSLHSNDNENNYKQWLMICKKNDWKKPYSTNIIENYQISVKKLINEILKPKNIKYCFFSISSYLLNEELYIENILNQMELSYDIYPKNLKGLYRIENNDKIDPYSNNTLVILENGEKEKLYQHQRSNFTNIELFNADLKYYKNKTYWTNDGSLKNQE